MLLAAGLALIAVATVFILPGVALPPTAMRAFRAAQLLLHSFGLLAASPAGSLSALAHGLSLGDGALASTPGSSPPPGAWTWGAWTWGAWTLAAWTCAWLC